MLFLDVPPFDVLTGQAVPYIGFGETASFQSEFPIAYLETVGHAKKRVAEMFGIDSGCGVKTIQQVEDAIARMWLDGWNPRKADVNLFTTDFGCVFMECLRHEYGGMTVFRSEADLTHVSLWWSEKGVEAFPFHVIFTRLAVPEGKSLSHFANALRSFVQAA